MRNTFLKILFYVRGLRFSPPLHVTPLITSKKSEHPNSPHREAGDIWVATQHSNHFFTPTDIILPSGLNSSCKILAISGAHIDSVTAIYLLPRKQDKCMDVQGKGRWWRRPGKIHVIKRRQHHKYSDPGRGKIRYEELMVGWSSENLNGTPKKTNLRMIFIWLLKDTCTQNGIGLTTRRCLGLS